jgi:hypothetical protein
MANFTMFHHAPQQVRALVTIELNLVRDRLWLVSHTSPRIHQPIFAYAGSTYSIARFPLMGQIYPHLNAEARPYVT